MKRRQFITLLGGAAATWPLAGLAQEAGKVRRIGFLRVGEPPAAFIDSFRRGLREVGLVEDRDFVIEFALAPFLNSITSSARASTLAGISRPRALAVLRLMTRSYLVGACTGRLAGFSSRACR